MIESMKALKGTEIVPGKRLYFETQGPNGEDKAKKDSSVHASEGNGKQCETHGPKGNDANGQGFEMICFLPGQGGEGATDELAGGGGGDCRGESQLQLDWR